MSEACLRVALQDLAAPSAPSTISLMSFIFSKQNIQLGVYASDRQVWLDWDVDSLRVLRLRRYAQQHHHL